MPLNVDMTGKVAIVTGASRGIGKATAERLWEAGATIVVNARTINSDAFARQQEERRGSVMVVEGPAHQADFCRGLVRQVFSAHRRLDILVNNAGVMEASFLGMAPDQQIEDVVKINLTGLLHMTQAATRLMARGGGGAIVNLASIVGRFGAPGLVVYSASKAGVIGATLAAAKELAPQKIRVNAVAPGFISTQMTDRLDPDVRAQLQSQIGMGRPGTPEDVADAIVFLASDLAGYVTGQVLGVDGAYVL